MKPAPKVPASTCCARHPVQQAGTTQVGTIAGRSAQAPLGRVSPGTARL